MREKNAPLDLRLRHEVEVGPGRAEAEELAAKVGHLEEEARPERWKAFEEVGCLVARLADGQPELLQLF